MDTRRLIGFGLLVFCFGAAVLLGGSLWLFVNIPSVIIVFGGGLGGLLVYKGNNTIEPEEALFLFGRFALWSGLIGSIIGCVQMLANLSDPKAIGPAMAVGLLTTLYGISLYILCFAIAGKKLKQIEGLKADVLSVFLMIFTSTYTLGGLVTAFYWHIPPTGS